LQQSSNVLQGAPVGEQSVPQMPPLQFWLQHSDAAEHALPSGAHGPEEHAPPAHESEQHCWESLHGAPSGAQPPPQRPLMHALSQQSLDVPQAAPVSAQDGPSGGASLVPASEGVTSSSSALRPPQPAAMKAVAMAEARRSNSQAA
jgi:hypothetical protein